MQRSYFEREKVCIKSIDSHVVNQMCFIPDSLFEMHFGIDILIPEESLYASH